MDTGLACKSFQYNNDEESFRLILKCTELVSVNSAHGYKLRGESSARVFDAPNTIRFKSEIRDQLTLADPRKYCKWITPEKFYYIAVKYLFNHNFLARDVDNVHKYTQDMLAESCYINDSHILEVHIWKNFKPGDFEYIIIDFGVTKYDYNQFR